MIHFSGNLSEFASLPTVNRRWFMWQLRYDADPITETLMKIEMHFRITHKSAGGEELKKLENNDVVLITKREESLLLPISAIDGLLTQMGLPTIGTNPELLAVTNEGHVIDIDFVEVVLNNNILGIIDLVRVIVALRDVTGYLNGKIGY
jgi:hypothetical protein